MINLGKACYFTGFIVMATGIWMNHSVPIEVKIIVTGFFIGLTGVVIHSMADF